MGPADRKLEPRPEALHAVDMAIAVHVLTRAVIDRLMLESDLLESTIRLEFVGMDRAAFLNIGFDDGLQGLLTHIRDDLEHDIAVALQHPEQDCLVAPVAPAPALDLATDIGFVRFDGTATAQGPLAVRFGHVLADLVRHAPRALVAHAKLALKLLGRDAVLRRGKQVHGVKPLVQRQVGPVHERPRRRVQVILAVLAHIGPRGRHAVEPRKLATHPAIELQAAVARDHDLLQARFVVRVALLKLIERKHLFSHPMYAL